MNIKEKKKKKAPLRKKESLSPELTDVQMLGEQSNFIRTYVPVTTFRLLFPYQIHQATAIAEYTSKVIGFTTTPEMAEFLDSLPNKAKYIREAIQEKMDRETEKK